MTTAKTVAAVALLTAAAAGCSSGSTAATANTAATSNPTATTASPPSPTPAAPANATQVIAGLKTAGQPITTVTTYTAATDPNHLLGRPDGYRSKAAFVDTRIDPSQATDTSTGSVDLGGSVEMYATHAGAQHRAAYIQAAENAAPITGTEYDYVTGPVLLRVSALLTPAQAKGYQAKLATVMAR